MNLPVVLVVIMIVALAALFLYHILGAREVWDLDQAEGRLAGLRRERDKLLRALKDIELEHEAGMIRDEEYYPLRQSLKRQAVRALKDLERVRESRLRRLAKRGGPVGASPALRRRVENLVEKRKEAS